MLTEAEIRALLTRLDCDFGLWADLRYATRLLTRSPGFTLAAVTALALAIGANVTVFTLANAFLFKNLPFDDSERILYVSSRIPRGRAPAACRIRISSTIREQVPSFEGMAAFTSGSVDLSDGEGIPGAISQRAADRRGVCDHRSAAVRSAVTSWQTTSGPARRRSAIVSYALWQGRYGSDPASSDRTIRDQRCRRRRSSA